MLRGGSLTSYTLPEKMFLLQLDHSRSTRSTRQNHSQQVPLGWGKNSDCVPSRGKVVSLKATMGRKERHRESSMQTGRQSPALKKLCLNTSALKRSHLLLMGVSPCPGTVSQHWQPAMSTSSTPVDPPSKYQKTQTACYWTRPLPGYYSVNSTIQQLFTEHLLCIRCYKQSRDDLKDACGFYANSLPFFY